MITTISKLTERLEGDGEFTIVAARQNPEWHNLWSLTVIDNGSDNKRLQSPSNAQTNAATRQNTEAAPEANLLEAAKILQDMLATYNDNLGENPKSQIKEALASGNADKISATVERTKAYLAKKGIKVA